MTEKPAAPSGLDRLLAPRSVAVIGASADPVRIGGRPIAYMRRYGFAGAILPVNPNRAEIQGLRAYPSIADLPETPDAAIVAVPGDLALQAVEELGQRGTGAAIVFTAGFAEADAKGAAAQGRMLDAARAHGMRLLGPNCLGLFNARIGWFATFTASLQSGDPVPGRIGIASQSGAYGTHVFAVARNRGIGTPVCVTTGNEADVTIADAMLWLAQDDETDVIAANAEGIRDAPGFLAALEAARRARKPVVMMKVGRSALGQTAARSHTASIAGDDAVTDAVLREFGVVRARTTEEMLDIAATATRRIYPARNTLGVITVSGGAGVLISDAAEAAGVEMPPMPEAAQARLLEAVPYAAPRNPVDCTAQVANEPALIRTFAEAMVEEGGYASVLAFFSQTAAGSIGPHLRAHLEEIKARHPDRLYVLSVIVPPEQARDFEADGFVVFEDPTRAVNAIAAMGRFGEAFARAAPLPPPALPPVTLPAATPSEAEAKRVLAASGIATVPERACISAEAAVGAAREFGFPVVMKILSPDILHKSEIGGVLLDLAGEDAVHQGFATLLDRARTHAPAARIEGVLVARQMPRDGVECILGIHRDPVFGPVAMVGLGGIFVEVLRDVAFRRCPFGEDEAERMIRSLRGAALLLGARGRPPVDIPALARMLARLSAFAVAAGPRLAAVDLNPVFALKKGEGAFAADAVLEVVAGRGRDLGRDGEA